MNTAEFRWPIRVYYEDTDAAGIVYHAKSTGHTSSVFILGGGSNVLFTRDVQALVVKVDLFLPLLLLPLVTVVGELLVLLLLLVGVLQLLLLLLLFDL